MVRPVGEQAQGAGDERGLGGHRHAPADPLHAPAVDGAGLDVADVAGVQAEAEGERPQHGDRPAHQAVAVGHQGDGDGDGGDVTGGDGAAPDRRGQPSVGEPEQQVHGDGREQGRRQPQAEVPERRRGAVERVVLEHRCGERAAATHDGAGEDDRCEAVVAPAQAEGEPGAGPEGDDERADELDRQGVVAQRDDGAGDGKGDSDRGDEQAVRRSQRGERRRRRHGRRGGWQGGLDDRRHHHVSAHHGPWRGQGCCHRRPGGASHTPSDRVARAGQPGSTYSDARVLDGRGSSARRVGGTSGGAAGGELGEGEGDGERRRRAVTTGAHQGRPCSSTTPSRSAVAGPHEPPDDDPERDADRATPPTTIVDRRPAGRRPRSGGRQPERSPDDDVPAATAQHGHERVQQARRRRGRRGTRRATTAAARPRRGCRSPTATEPARTRPSASSARPPSVRRRGRRRRMRHGRLAAVRAVARHGGERLQPAPSTPRSRRRPRRCPTPTTSPTTVSAASPPGPLDPHACRRGRRPSSSRTWRPSATSSGPAGGAAADDRRARPAGDGVEGARVPRGRSAGPGERRDRLSSAQRTPTASTPGLEPGRRRRRRRPRRRVPRHARSASAPNSRPSDTSRSRPASNDHTPSTPATPMAVATMAPPAASRPRASRAGRQGDPEQAGRTDAGRAGRRTAAIRASRGRTDRRVATTRIAGTDRRGPRASPSVRTSASIRTPGSTSGAPGEAAGRQRAERRWRATHRPDRAGDDRRRRAPAPRRAVCCLVRRPERAGDVALLGRRGRLAGDRLGDDDEAGERRRRGRAAASRRPRRRCRWRRARGARRPPRSRRRTRTARTARPSAGHRLVAHVPARRRSMSMHVQWITWSP